MNRRTFLRLLGLAPALPLAAKIPALPPIPVKWNITRIDSQSHLIIHNFTVRPMTKCCTPEYEAAVDKIMIGAGVQSKADLERWFFGEPKL